MLNFGLSLGKTGYKKMLYNGASWFFVKENGDGSIELRSPNKNIANVLVPKQYVKYIHNGWK